MATPSLGLRADISATLARLRIARTVGDTAEIRSSERRLDWLLGQVPHEVQPEQPMETAQ